MDDEEDSYDEVDFLLVNWHLHGEAEIGDNSSEGEGTTNIRISADVEFPRWLHQLAMDDVGEMRGTDLHSIVRRVGSPFLCQRSHNIDADGLEHQTTNITNERSGTNSRKNACIICNIIDMRQRVNAIQHYMGTLAQCRGTGGDVLREAGAISALLNVLWRLKVPSISDNSKTIVLLPQIAFTEDGANLDSMILCDYHLHLRKDDPYFNDVVLNEFDMTALELATSCLGSLRDLSCGSALNRAAILAWTPQSPCKVAFIENGVQLLNSYVKRYDQWKWEEILSLQQRRPDKHIAEFATECASSTDRGKKELRLLTNALGTVRNSSHSTPDVCQEMFDHDLVDALVWRLMPSCKTKNGQSTTNSLPDVSLPWREACFRAAGSLINLAEKCPGVARQLGSNRELIHLLIETWGGASAVVFDQTKTSARALPILHLGLAAILNAAADGALADGLDELMVHVLKNETIRKRFAQKREEEKKLGRGKN
ncbi:hypothetical protein ACHAXA_002230 [Cyclostephanos tholiformis]|uniref:Uncharacterized protein n=1 Tax=Cyclostephanos tholiformis TaxID=382380 RepID=A0ABD3R6V9_9STRA